MGQGHSGESGRILVLCFHFLAKRIGQILNSGRCRACPSLLCGEGRESEFEQKQKNSHAFLEVCLRIIQELEEVRDFSCSEASYGRVVLAGVVFASKLSVVDFYFSLRRAEPEP